MKNKIIALAFMFVLLMCGCSQIKTEHHALQNAREIYYSPTRVESYTYGDFDRLQIRRTYLLCPDDDPSLIPTEDFEDNGRTYRLFDMTLEESDGRVLYTAIFNEIESY